MIVKITAKRQITLPARVLAALGVGPGDELELIEGHDRFTLKRRGIQYSRLGTLRSEISPGHPRSISTGFEGNRPTECFEIDTFVLIVLPA